MRFWDSSAVVPLLVRESSTVVVQAILAEDREVAVWWATEVECISALTRLERQKQIAGDQLMLALRRLDEFAAEWHEIAATREVREKAKRYLRLHPLTAADALQLAAAVLASEDDPSSLAFVSLDSRLREAAARQGFMRLFPIAL